MQKQLIQIGGVRTFALRLAIQQKIKVLVPALAVLAAFSILYTWLLQVNDWSAFLRGLRHVDPEMNSFVLFHVYLITGIASVIISAIALIRKDYETLGVLLVLFLYSLIGLSCNLPGWLRTFCGLYGIVLSG
jgi:hypothetical protein